ncbi:RNA repair transcriptional activator RtcR [Pseudomonas sp. FEN]|uniref:RNA repair transcriptional activator RtcR n=1 Tax=Pseudomonas sp. FEN TaxID=2767468 RepID=UPI00174AAEE1|nr:RNA repair transcriptional activator RtcR [Pseudomonas sp. FEN]
MLAKRCVTLGFIGSTLDRVGKGANRWSHWRPSVGLCQQPDLLVHRFELIHGTDARDVSLAERVRNDIQQVSPETEVRLHPMTLRNPWDFEEVYATLHDFTTEYSFDTEHEEYLVHITTGTHVAQICWFLLTEARYLPARLIQTSPARHLNEEARVIGTHALIDLDLSRYDRIATRFTHKRLEGLAFLKSGIATRNAAFNRTIEQIERVAVRSRAPMLLIGPTGAGKSFLARRIYELKRSRHQIQGRFVEVNCATLRGDGAMSALFGHIKGAFTGAQNNREGLLRAADTGLLFLDELGELGLDEQVMLLKAVEEKRFFPLGSDKEVDSDFLIIAGTHRDLRSRVAEGLFREDLYARINLWTFDLPGLAGRREDIEPNLDFELERHAREQGHLARFNAEARRRYLTFACSSEASWLGNFRELSASITRMATLADSGRIDEAQVEDEIERLRRAWGLAEPQDALDQLLGENTREFDLFDRLQLKAVIEICRRASSLSDAGRQLFNASRQTKTNPNDADRLRKYLARFGLYWKQLNNGNEVFNSENSEHLRKKTVQ